MLNKSGKSEHPCLIPDIRQEAFNFLLLSIIYAVGLSYVAFIMLRYVPYVLTLLRVFTLTRSWILSNAFSASIEMIVIFIIRFVNVLYHIDWFADVRPLLHLWNSNKFNLGCTAEFGLLIFVENFDIYVHQHCWPIIFKIFVSLWHSFLVLVSGQCWLYKMSMEVFLLLFSGRVWKELILILWIFGRIHHWGYLVLNFCLLRGFWLLS